jgi:FkbM family methyltransferase
MTALETAVKNALRPFVRVLPSAVRHRVRKAYSRYNLRREEPPPEFAIIRQLITDCDVVVDAGANLGLYTVFLARHAPNALVLSIEPTPSTFDILASNVAGLGLRNVRPLRLALSDREHEVTMEVPEDAHGEPVHYLARIKFTEQGKRPRSRHVVAAVTLDSLLPGHAGRVGFIKYDVEMHELESITGSLGIIGRDRPAIYAEIQPDLKYKRSQLHDIVALLRPFGYEPFWYDGKTLRGWAEEGRPLDYFFLTADHHRRLAEGPAVPQGSSPGGPP